MSKILKTGVINTSGYPNDNLAINSKRNIGPNSSYNIANFNTSKEITAGKKYTATIKGTIGENKWFGLWMGGGYTGLGQCSEVEEGLFKLTFTSPTTIAGNGSRVVINVYAGPSNNSNQSSIEWFKLEEGTASTLWIPNINDSNYLTKSSFFEIDDNCKFQKNGYIQSKEFIEY